MFAKWFAAGTLVLVLGLSRPGRPRPNIRTDPPADGARPRQANRFRRRPRAANSPAWRPPAQMPRDAAGSSEPIRPLTPLGPRRRLPT